MDKKIILVTGASSGIGKETATTLAKNGHTVILHGRDEGKDEEGFEEIKDLSGNNDLDMYTADLSLMKEVNVFAETIKNKYDYIDVLINNAGGQFGFVREETSEGHEKTMAINLLAPFLLTNLLLDLLSKSNNPRVVTVASESYRQGGKPILDDIELKNNYSVTKIYGLSKLYVYWIMQYFALNAKSMGYGNIMFNTVEPGSVDTNLGRVSAQKGIGKIVYNLWKVMMQPVDKGAATSIYMATSDEVINTTGKFYGNLKEKTIKEKYQFEAGGDIIWDYCTEVCKTFLN